MGKTDSKHDISILDVNDKEIGLTLIRGRNNTPLYDEITDDPLATQYYAGEPSYQYTNPEKEMILAQEDFRGGFGLEYADSTDRKRYFYGINIDGRFRDKVILGGLSTTVTKPTLLYITDGELDIWTDASTLTNWTNGQGGVGGGTLAREATTVYSGTYSARLTTAGVQSISLYQDLSNWATAFQGKSITITAWVHCASTAGTHQIQITDDGGTTSTNCTKDGAWHKNTVTRVINAAATYVRFSYYCETGGGDAGTMYCDLVETGTYNSFDCQAEFNSNHWVSSGKTLFSLNATASALVYEACFPANITDLITGTVSGADYLFICLGWSDAYWYLSAAGTYTQSNAATNTMKYMAVSSTTFYGSDTNSTIQSTAGPLNGGAAWGSSKQFGEDTFNIVDLKEYGGLIYAKKSDCKVYYLDSSGDPQVLVSGQQNLAGTNTARMYVWREGLLIIPYGRQGLLAYDESTIEHIAPSLSATNTPDFAGQVQAVTGDEMYLYVVLDNDTKVEVLAGSEQTIDSVTDWRWHTLNEITLTNCASAMISSVYKKRIWIGSTIWSESFYYVPVTTKYASISDDSDMTYLSGGYIITPYLHGNFKNEKKAWIKVTLKMEDTTDAIYWRAYYQKLGDTVWTEINALDFFKTSPVTTAYIPVDADGDVPTAEFMRFKFEGITGTTTISPVLLGYDIRAVWYPPTRRLIRFSCLAENNILLPNGQIDEQRASTIRDTLYNINSSDYPRAFYPPYWESGNDTVYVKMIHPIQYQLMYDESIKKQAWAYAIQLLVVPLA